jgi:hypothetical protein
MGVETAILLAAGATAALGGYASYEQARRQNNATQQTQRSVVRAAEIQSQQVAQAAATQRQDIVRKSQLTRDRIRILQGESGLSGGSYESLDRQVSADAQNSYARLDTEYVNQINRVNSGMEADLARLQGQYTNSVLAALTGGLGGANTGLSLGTGVRNIIQ